VKNAQTVGVEPDPPNSMKHQLSRTLLALCLFLLATSLQAAPAVVVKVARPVLLDKPDQWPAITAEQHMATSGGESARWIACYDAETLYLLVRVRDESPMKNSASPFDPAMAIKGGDAVGFCFGPSGDRGQLQRILVANLDGKPMGICYRPLSKKKKPYSFASPVSTYVMDYVAPLPEVRAVFSLIDGGYAVGVAIPWKVLDYRVTEGLEFPFDAQVIFSDPAGTKNIATAWWHSRGNGPACTVDLPSEARLYPDLWGSARLFTADPGPQPDPDEAPQTPIVVDPDGLKPVPIVFTLPRACKASLVITDTNGWIVAEPLRAESLSAGSHTILWNGRGYRDMPLPAGHYHWRLGYFDGVRSLFLGAAGNSGRPPYPSADKKGSIGGVHIGPAAVAADAGGVYLLHAGEEGEHGLRKIDKAGNVLWTHSTGNYAPASAVAVDGQRAYMIAGWPELALLCMDAATGRDLPMGEAGARITLGDPKKTFVGLAVVGGKAYVSVAAEDRLAVIDVTTGQKAADIPLTRPGRLCRQDDTHLLAISGDTVVRLDLATRDVQTVGVEPGPPNGQPHRQFPAEGGRGSTRAATPLLTGLTAPSAIAVDGAGQLYVAEQGNKQQITRFQADGTCLVSFGKPGGRAATVPKYDPMEFHNITDLACDAEGQLWFVEAGWTAPRRIGCLSAVGQWVRDYCGPVYCSSGMVVDLDDPATVYYHLGPSWMKTRVGFSPTHNWRDFDWRIEAIYYLSQSGTETPAVPDLMLGPASPSFAEGITFTGTNGLKYFWIDGEVTYTRNSQPAALWRWANDRWVPTGIQSQYGKPCWADRNGDGLVQSNEYSTVVAPDGGWRWLGRDLTLYGRHGAWKPARIDERGVPDYDGGTYTPYAATPYPDWFSCIAGSHEVAVSRPGPDGAVYYTANLGNGQGRAFWDRASENKLIKVKDGQVQWWIGHHDAANHTNGDGTIFYNVCGVEDGVIVVSDVANQYTAYTDDGLTLGWLLTDDNGRPRWSDDSYVSAESFSGQFIKDSKTGKYLLFCGASESCQVREVVGIGHGKITRQKGDVILPSSLPRTTPSPRATIIPYGTWECANGRFNGIDGEDWEWWPRNYETITIRDGKQIVADVRLRRDAGYMHLFADVLQPAGFHAPADNAGATPGGLYGKADGVELLLGPLLPPDRMAAVAGDARVLLTARRDEKGKLKGLALACRPASPPLPPDPLLRPMNNDGSLRGAPPKEALSFATGWQPIPGASVALGTRPDGKGFRLEAELPLAFFPEVATIRPVTFKRWTDGGNHWIKSYTENRYDLAGPVRLNVAVFSTDAAGTVRRLPWLVDGPAATNSAAMTPRDWGVANAATTLGWTAQPGAKEYQIYRAATPELAAAKPVQGVRGGTTTTDFPGIGTHYYWLTAIDALGESQFLGPEAIIVGGQTTQEPRVDFRGAPAPVILFPNLLDLEIFPDAARVINFTVAAKSVTPEVLPAGANVTTEPMGNGRWRMVVTLPSGTKPGTRYAVALTAVGEAKPVKAAFFVTASPVAVAGQLTQTGGKLAIDAAAPAGQPAATVLWPGQGLLPTEKVGRSGYVLFRHNGNPDPTRVVRAPFADTFAGGDGFWYGADGGNMRFDLCKADGTIQPGQDAQGRRFFGSVNSNAGTPGKPETYPGAQWTVQVSDAAAHLLTVFSPAKEASAAKQRFVLRSATGDFPPAIVEFDGRQGGAVIQFRFIGNATLSVQQTVGGMGSSNPGANCAALFLD